MQPKHYPKTGKGKPEPTVLASLASHGKSTQRGHTLEAT